LGLLTNLQAEIDTMGWALDVHFLGVNEIIDALGNRLVEAVTDLPWLQDIEEQDVWEKWDVAFRDLVILNEKNEHVATFNLQTYDLRIPKNVDSLRTLLSTFAEDAPNPAE
jgi:hypothetical protein